MCQIHTMPGTSGHQCLCTLMPSECGGREPLWSGRGMPALSVLDADVPLIGDRWKKHLIVLGPTQVKEKQVMNDITMARQHQYFTNKDSLVSAHELIH